jgi:hypothetical protein
MGARLGLDFSREQTKFDIKSKSAPIRLGEVRDGERLGMRSRQEATP